MNFECVAASSRFCICTKSCILVLLIVRIIINICGYFSVFTIALIILLGDIVIMQSYTKILLVINQPFFFFFITWLYFWFWFDFFQYCSLFLVIISLACLICERYKDEPHAPPGFLEDRIFKNSAQLLRTALNHSTSFNFLENFDSGEQERTFSIYDPKLYYH